MTAPPEPPEEIAALPRSHAGVLARILTRAEDVGVAITITAVTSIVLVEAALDDLVHWHFVPLPPCPATFALVTVLLALGGIGPWLVRAARPERVAVGLGEGFVALGSKRIGASEVRGVRVAEGARGMSVAIARGVRGAVTFVEVESAADAAAILAALGVAKAPHGEVPLRRRGRSVLTWARAVLTLITLAATLAYAGDVFAFGPAAWAHKPYGLFGVAASLLAALTMLVQLAPRMRGRSASVVVARGAWDAHVALHEASDVALAADFGAGLVRAAAHAPLARGRDAARAWLTRLDALAPRGIGGEGAYRGDAMKRDVLWDALRDESAAPDVRMAAARLLRLRYAEDDAALTSAVVDGDVRVRVGAALEEDDEHAAERIERLGPLFRAR